MDPPINKLSSILPSPISERFDRIKEAMMHLDKAAFELEGRLAPIAPAGPEGHQAISAADPSCPLDDKLRDIEIHTQSLAHRIGQMIINLKL